MTDDRERRLTRPAPTRTGATQTQAPQTQATVPPVAESDLLAQVRDLADIAAEADDHCVRGVDAERELKARHNASGQ